MLLLKHGVISEPLLCCLQPKPAKKPKTSSKGMRLGEFLPPPKNEALGAGSSKVRVKIFAEYACWQTISLDLTVIGLTQGCCPV